MLVGKRQFSSVVKLAALAELFRALNVWLGDIDTVRFEARLREPSDDLPDATAEINHSAAGRIGAQSVGIFRVKVRVPVRQKFRVGFVVAITFLVAHA